MAGEALQVCPKCATTEMGGNRIRPRNGPPESSRTLLVLLGAAGMLQRCSGSILGMLRGCCGDAIAAVQPPLLRHCQCCWAPSRAKRMYLAGQLLPSLLQLRHALNRDLAT